MPPELATKARSPLPGLLTPPTNMSAWPYSVTLDWAMAAPEKSMAATAASLIAGLEAGLLLYCFCMVKTSVVVMPAQNVSCVCRNPSGSLWCVERCCPSFSLFFQLPRYACRGN
ncbi:hypothetical protein D3C86_1882040 [compost metagenome]